MGVAKLPFYAYVDETGNTGSNVFDDQQPDFYTAALVTKGNFDLVFGDNVKAISDKLGVAGLHGKELGAKRIASVARDIVRVLSIAKAQFFVSHVEKSYLLATKIFDTFFDSGENAAVAWHHYNLRPMKLTLAFKLAQAVSYETAQLFWKCILEANEKKHRELLLEVCSALRKDVARMKDASAKKIFDDALAWAQKYPECIEVYQGQRTGRQGHFPNMVAFANLLTGLEDHSKRFKKRVARITHDRQKEFEKNLAAMHDMYSNASPEEVNWAGETYSLQRVVGSTFEVKEDGASPGIQIADTILWLHLQSEKGVDLPPECHGLLNYAYENGWQSDFSFDGVGTQLNDALREMWNTPITDKQQAFAKKYLEDLEEHRQRVMERYERDGQSPYMNSRSDVHTVTTAKLVGKAGQ